MGKETRDEPLRTSAWEANVSRDLLDKIPTRTCQGIRRKSAIFLETEVRFVPWKYFSVLCREHAKSRLDFSPWIE